MCVGSSTCRWAASVAVSVALSCAVGFAGEIESLLRRSLPPSVDAAPDVQHGLRARAYPLKPLARLPFYGLPYGLVDTTTGNLAFEVGDLSLPGRMPIVMSHLLATGMENDFPAPPLGQLVSPFP